MVDFELIALLGAVAAATVLAVAPFAVIYAVAFIALTPILGVILWLLLGGVRGARVPMFPQRVVMRALERLPRSDLANRFATLFVATLRVARAPGLPRRSHAGPEEAPAEQATQRDPTVRP
jgi:hypothetical protein